jgi:hypothetical protein
MTPLIANESERDRLERIAIDYQTQGYDVKVQPRPNDLPDFLADFKPDLIASGKGETIVVDVKTRGQLSDAPLAAGLEAALKNRPGWRFELIIDGTAMEPRQTIGATQIRALLEEATELEQRKHPAAALLMLWSATEGALRLLANRENVELESLAPGYLVTRLYTLGLLGREQYQTLDGTMRLRNQAAHGFQVAVTPEDLTGIAVVLNGLLNEVEVKAA